jgi:hypothetical protein
MPPFTTSYPLTFCFYEYGRATKSSLMNCWMSTWTGKYIHCEIYDGRSQTSAYVTSTTNTLVEAIHSYGREYDFITVYLTEQQWVRYREAVRTHAGWTPFSNLSICWFPFNCLCKGGSPESAICSDITAQLINSIWPEYQLSRPTYMYSPTDIHTVLTTMTQTNMVPYQSPSANPRPSLPRRSDIIE